MAVPEIEVGRLGELIDRLTPSQPDPKIERRRDTGVYRGMADARWPLLTSLDQLGGTRLPHTKAGLEEHILQNYIRYSRPYLPGPPANEWESLVSAQHHGVPTCLPFGDLGGDFKVQALRRANLVFGLVRDGLGLFVNGPGDLVVVVVAHRPHLGRRQERHLDGENLEQRVFGPRPADDFMNGRLAAF